MQHYHEIPIFFSRGLGKNRHEIHGEEMDWSTPIEALHSNNLHHLLDRPRHRAGIRRADSETVLGNSYGAVAAEK